ncbi:putative ATP-grasp-modified RiPP [Streptosporangium sp. NBC_01810]|uniref:putative ATP-grasp-modified RiPP n=1 Tax=Streptosporangium sp. NBC_01810 TaxID=2975951 RepID=UPI002DD9D1ED|nr:putative ATP-grasp-modified RiPP [Streptosporangium sp. NBC_01810]WSA26292.1 putative ATP-grasp-modified RiPP [Streptosporangium sp. NBC_01810]
MDNLRRKPWGLTRATPFSAAAHTSARTHRVELDPVAQTGVYSDAVTGQPIEAGKHGTNREQATATAPPTTDGSGGGGGGTADSHTDWVSD